MIYYLKSMISRCVCMSRKNIAYIYQLLFSDSHVCLNYISVFGQAPGEVSATD